MDFYMGTILPWALDYAPEGWQLCQGQSLTISQNQALYSLLGIKYGGDGQNTFNLPDLRGKVMIGSGQGVLNNKQLTPHNLGTTGGAESISLSSINMPPHTHALTGNTNVNLTETNIPSNNSLLGVATDSYKKPANIYTDVSSGQTQLINMNSQSIGITGGQNGASVPISVMQPFQTINFIICTQGLYPMRP